ncbi:hypothetical protein PLESTB_001334700 [Pleodorina starrii]|uniref:CCZ1/INTU/HSP4 first Longin domain-containing protein n=1 Tax=Pleodorina starrii TaxID=330485 RepID=A0A9W6BUR6_9CHLO|nr:hypothetical protein PLESTM_001464100 [Pleodorina starrii]GLC58220.1 hypothetical protein PLESTB_001334700 [Pleodorina starrii]GLC66433.1 hypothetical protein PLESTF_000426800 [Pleodorina starrii]
MPAASHHSLLHAAFIVSTDSGRPDDDADHSLVYSYPSNAPPGSTGGFVKSFSSLIVTVRGALDSICGEKTRLVHLEHGGRRLLLASAHLESVMLVLALRSTVPPAAATSLALHLAETLVLLLGPCGEWGLSGARGLAGAAASTAGGESSRQEDTRAILDRIFEGVLSQVDSPSWGPRMAPWNSFESSCLHLALPPPLHTRLAGLLADHGAQRSRAPFSFFQKHSCLMYRGLILASDLHPTHAKQLWHLLWTLGLHQHSGGLPCQLLTRTVHLPQLQLQPPAGAAAAAAAAAGRGGGAAAAAAGSAAAAAAAAVALQAESGVMVSEQQMGRGLLVVAAAMRLVLVVVLTAYDEEIEEELAGRLEGHSAAELLHRLHTGLGADLERLVEGSAIYSAAARALESPPPPPPPHPHLRSDSSLPPVGKAAHGSGSGSGGGSLLFRVITRNRSSPPRHSTIGSSGGGGGGGGADGGGGPAGGSGGGGGGGGGEGPLSGSPSGSLPRPRSHLATSLPPGQPITPGPSATPAPAGRPPAGAAAEGTLPPAGQTHDRVTRGSVGPGGGAFQPVGSPFEGVLLVIANDAPHGCVRFLGDVPAGGSAGVAAGPGPGLGEAALAAVWRAVAACRARFGLHNVAVAAPPKHARLTMTLDQILQLSAARSNKLGGQRLGAADSSPWQYHPELASLAAVNTVTLRLPISLPPQPGPLPLPRTSGLGAGNVGGSVGGSPAAAAVVAAGGGGGWGGSPAERRSAGGGGGGGSGGAAAAAAVASATMTPPSKKWLSRISGSLRGCPTTPTSAEGTPSPSAGPGPGPFSTAAGISAAGGVTGSPDPSTPFSGLVPALSGFDSLSLPHSHSHGGSPPCATPQGAAVTGTGLGFGASSGCPSSCALYLTGLLFPDTREVFLCHTADVDEGRLAEAIWEAASGFGGGAAGGGSVGGAGAAGELWGQED